MTPVSKVSQLVGELETLRRELEEVKRSLPKHSVSAMHIMRMEELEEAIEEKEMALKRLRT